MTEVTSHVIPSGLLHWWPTSRQKSIEWHTIQKDGRKRSGVIKLSENKEEFPGCSDFLCCWTYFFSFFLSFLILSKAITQKFTYTNCLTALSQNQLNLMELTDRTFSTSMLCRFFLFCFSYTSSLMLRNSTRETRKARKHMLNLGNENNVTLSQ